ncbi:transcription elongation factor, mitochondrial-like isoform X1 [Penaeus chinensis]|uniref:transcription elongation factor, mitochondrial-like isoform X1 n=2 Tax=Penaeus chinensis TaxID=139456 RepID=UPI001FB6E596|nr:transcription elongation factor, mitochondrial-like isoform X1 [Penaeus chinensis]
MAFVSTIRLSRIYGSSYQTNLSWICTSHAQASSEENGKPYDISTYQFPYTLEERSLILSIINNATEEMLARLKVSKSMRKKLLKDRHQTGSYMDLSQLLNVDGMGIKSVEQLCSFILKDMGETEKETDPNDSSFVYKKRLVKPRLQQHVLKNIKTLVSLDVTVGFLSWTKLDNKSAVLDVNCEEILTASSRLDLPKLYEKVVNISKRIPVADAYVWEEKANYGHLQGATLGIIIASLQLAQIRGMLTALLEPCHGRGAEKRLFYLRDALVSKLFRLKVGSERISGINLADQLVKGHQLLEWLPALDISKEAQTKFITCERTKRRHMATSLFIGLAFSQVLILQNKNALKILSR